MILLALLEVAFYSTVAGDALNLCEQETVLDCPEQYFSLRWDGCVFFHLPHHCFTFSTIAEQLARLRVLYCAGPHNSTAAGVPGSDFMLTLYLKKTPIERPAEFNDFTNETCITGGLRQFLCRRPKTQDFTSKCAAEVFQLRASCSPPPVSHIPAQST